MHNTQIMRLNWLEKINSHLKGIKTRKEMVVVENVREGWIEMDLGKPEGFITMCEDKVRENGGLNLLRERDPFIDE